MIRYLLRVGVRRGVLGGSRAWLTIGAVAGTIRLLQRMAHREPEVLLSEKLPEGGVLVIANKGTTG